MAKDLLKYVDDKDVINMKDRIIKFEKEGNLVEVEKLRLQLILMENRTAEKVRDEI